MTDPKMTGEQVLKVIDAAFRSDADADDLIQARIAVAQLIEDNKALREHRLRDIGELYVVTQPAAVENEMEYMESKMNDQIEGAISQNEQLLRDLDATRKLARELVYALKSCDCIMDSANLSGPNGMGELLARAAKELGEGAALSPSAQGKG